MNEERTLHEIMDAGAWLIRDAVERVIDRHTAEWQKVVDGWALDDAKREFEKEQDRPRAKLDDYLAQLQGRPGDIVPMNGDQFAAFRAQQLQAAAFDRCPTCGRCSNGLQNLGMGGLGQMANQNALGQVMGNAALFGLGIGYTSIDPQHYRK